jgi:hypothetical protein
MVPMWPRAWVSGSRRWGRRRSRGRGVAARGASGAPGGALLSASVKCRLEFLSARGVEPRRVDRELSCFDQIGGLADKALSHFRWRT